MMSGPTYNRVQYPARIGERPVRIIAYSISQLMCIAGRIGEIIFSVIPVHPRGFEEPPVRIALQKRLPVFIKYDKVFGVLGKRKQVFRKPGYFRTKRG